tara:strand:+ start:980 stop:1390 length:411 start_codon:yes stop_codon:yes gene_type:complete
MEIINNWLKENNFLGYTENNTLNIVKPIFKTIKLPKNKDLITFEWINNKINQNNYKNLTNNFKKLIKKHNLSFNVYSTTYGIGVFNVMSIENIKILKDYLDLNKIKYKTEYSSKNWVFRFKISKNKENLNKIDNII